MIDDDQFLAEVPPDVDEDTWTEVLNDFAHEVEQKTLPSLTPSLTDTLLDTDFFQDDIQHYSGYLFFLSLFCFSASNLSSSFVHFLFFHFLFFFSLLFFKKEKKKNPAALWRTLVMRKIPHNQAASLTVSLKVRTMRRGNLCCTLYSSSAMILSTLGPRPLWAMRCAPSLSSF